MEFIGPEFSDTTGLTTGILGFSFFKLHKTPALLVSCVGFGDTSWVHPRLQGTRIPWGGF